MLQISRNKLFNNLHYWVLMPMKKDTLELNTEHVHSLLDSLYVPIDSHVTIVQIEKSQHEVLLKDVYRIGNKEELKITPQKEWSRGMFLYTRPNRTNYGGISIKASVLVSIHYL